MSLQAISQDVTGGPNQNESHVSSVYFNPSYCLIADGFARCTIYPASISPSTIQYQLKVDSTTIPCIFSLYGYNVFVISDKSLIDFF